MYDLQDWAAVQRVYKQTRSKRAIQCLLPDCRGRSRRYDQAKAITEKKTMTGKEKKPSIHERLEINVGHGDYCDLRLFVNC